MPAFAGMTFPCLYVALLAPLRDHGQLIGRVCCKALEPDSGADQQMIRGAGNGAKKNLAAGRERGGIRGPPGIASVAFCS